MTGSKPDRRRSSLDDETPGSQGEIPAGSEGDFGGPPNEPAHETNEPTDGPEQADRGDQG